LPPRPDEREMSHRARLGAVGPGSSMCEVTLEGGDGMARPWGRSEPLVRYVSPFGAPEWMTRRGAERRRSLDDRRWQRYLGIGCLTQRERELGPPRIEVVPICPRCRGTGKPRSSSEGVGIRGSCCPQCLGAGYLAEDWPPAASG
jgi:hypothetical protein